MIEKQAIYKNTCLTNIILLKAILQKGNSQKDIFKMLWCEIPYIQSVHETRTRTFVILTYYC